MAAPIGRNVSLYYDGVISLDIGDIIETSTTGRCYRVTSVRIQGRGMHTGRQHLRCDVIDPAEVKPYDRVVPITWYSRRRRRSPVVVGPLDFD